MAPITLTARQRADLETAAAHAPAARECRRAETLLWLASGESVEGVSELLGVSRQTAYTGLARFRERAGSDLRDRLADAPRRGRPRAGGGVVGSLVAAAVDSRKVAVALGSR